jgi:hypothetical protein
MTQWIVRRSGPRTTAMLVTASSEYRAREVFAQRLGYVDLADFLAANDNELPDVEPNLAEPADG